MKINKEIRRLTRQLLRASFTDGQLDQGKIASLTQTLVATKPRYYADILHNYKRLIRIELQKRHAIVESASELFPETTADITRSLRRKYGADLTTDFVVKPEHIGGLRIRVGSDVWDGTVRNRLERLQQEL